MQVEENLNIDDAVLGLQLKALQRHEKYQKVADALGITKRSVYRLIEKHNIIKYKGIWTATDILEKKVWNKAA